MNGDGRSSEVTMPSSVSCHSSPCAAVPVRSRALLVAEWLATTKLPVPTRLGAGVKLVPSSRVITNLEPSELDTAAYPAAGLLLIAVAMPPAIADRVRVELPVPRAYWKGEATPVRVTAQTSVAT